LHERARFSSSNMGATLSSMTELSAQWLMLLAPLAVAAAVGYITLTRICFFLGKDEQLVVDRLTDTEVVNGPGIQLVSPLVKSVSKRKGELLEPLDYVRIKDSLTGSVSVESGPKLHFLRPFDRVLKRGQGHSLSPVEYTIVKDKQTGEKRIERGPKMFLPSAYDEFGDKETALSLESNQYCRLRDTATGKRWTVRGPALLFPEPTWEVQGGVLTAISLKRTEYVRLIDETTGAIRVERGEQMVFPEATESILPEDGAKLTAINLKVFQYVKLIDNASGVIRVVRGEATVFLGPTESVIGKGKTDAVEIDAETAVRVRSKRTGELTLVSAESNEGIVRDEGSAKAGAAAMRPGLFFPKPEESIEEVQKLIKLADYECMIIVNQSGELAFYYGDDAKRGAKPRAFFIPPHHQSYALTWSRGRRRERRDLKVERIDTRPQFMSFEFNTRTSDNVELVLEGTFFWQVVDVERMVKMTGDTTGDICNHARSKFIQLVSKVTLKEFMDSFNSLAQTASQEDDAFYASRGVQIHTLEVTAYRCQDASTARILGQIIEETTNRMNRLSQQESENEVKMFAMAGEIEQETRRAELLKVVQAHKLMEAKNEGEAEAERVKSFLDSTKESVPDLDSRVGLWKTLRKQDALEAVSSGPAKLFFTPNDVDLTIETKDQRNDDASFDRGSF